MATNAIYISIAFMGASSLVRTRDLVWAKDVSISGHVTEDIFVTSRLCNESTCSLFRAFESLVTPSSLSISMAFIPKYHLFGSVYRCKMGFTTDPFVNQSYLPRS